MEILKVSRRFVLFNIVLHTAVTPEEVQCAYLDKNESDAHVAVNSFEIQSP